MLNLANSQRVWAEIDLSNLCHNYETAKKLSPGKDIIAVVKAGAYGHGAVEATRALASIGASHFAVATPEEAFELRASGYNGHLLVLGAVPPKAAPALAEAGVSVCAASYGHAKLMSEGLGPKAIKCHVKVDTGMFRLGIGWEEAQNEILKISKLPNIIVEGVFSHFASAGDDNEKQFTLGQYEKFLKVCDSIKGIGMDGLMIHCNCTDAILNLDTKIDNAIRPGIMLYGYGLGPEVGLKPVMSVRAAVVQTKWAEEGETVSYGRRWKAPSKRRIAVISAGYADGIMRIATNKMELIIEGKRARQVGTICMDMLMADITDIEEAKIGSAATIIGEDGGERVTASELAQNCQTIPYEVLCAISKRVPRHYLN